MRRIEYIVVHCTAGHATDTIAKLKAGWKKLGWRNNGYHIVVDGNGARHDITPLEKIANGVAGHNSNSIHVSYMGGVNFKSGKSEDTRTPEQKQQLISILSELKARFPEAKILGHRDLSRDRNNDGKIDRWEWIKACPSFDAIPEYENL